MVNGVPAIDNVFASLLVWAIVGLAACLAGAVALLIAWLGRPSGMLVGGVVLGVGLAMLLAMWWMIPRYWFIAVVPITLGIQTLRSWARHPTPNRWAFRLDTFAMLVIAISLLTAGSVALRRQVQREQELQEQIESRGGYVLEAFDGTVRVVLVRNASGATLDHIAPLIRQLGSLEEIGLEGTVCSNQTLLEMGARGITQLGLQNATLSPGVGKVLAEFTRVQVLDLMDAKNVTDAELPFLSKLQSLRRLYLTNTDVTPAAVEELRSRLPAAEISL